MSSISSRIKRINRRLDRTPFGRAVKIIVATSIAIVGLYALDCAVCSLHSFTCPGEGCDWEWCEYNY